MKLYTVFNNDLLNLLTESGHGAKLSGIDISCPTYADDISLVALHCSSLQAMLNIAYQHSTTWRYQFNPTKSSVLLFGTDIQNVSLRLGPHELTVNKTDKHLGIPLCTSPSLLENAMEVRISSCRRVVSGKPIPACPTPSVVQTLLVSGYPPDNLWDGAGVSKSRRSKVAGENPFIAS